MRRTRHKTKVLGDSSGLDTNILCSLYIYFPHTLCLIRVNRGSRDTKLFIKFKFTPFVSKSVLCVSKRLNYLKTLKTVKIPFVSRLNATR